MKPRKRDLRGKKHVVMVLPHQTIISPPPPPTTTTTSLLPLVWIKRLDDGFTVVPHGTERILLLLFVVEEVVVIEIEIVDVNAVDLVLEKERIPLRVRVTTEDAVNRDRDHVKAEGMVDRDHDRQEIILSAVVEDLVPVTGGDVGLDLRKIVVVRALEIIKKYVAVNGVRGVVHDLQTSVIVIVVVEGFALVREEVVSQDHDLKNLMMMIIRREEDISQDHDLKNLMMMIMRREEDISQDHDLMMMMMIVRREEEEELRGVVQDL